MERQTLTEEKFKEMYKEKFTASDREIRQAEFLHAYMIKRPNYFENDSRLEPRERKVKITSFAQFYGKMMLSRIFRLEGAEFTDSIEEADIGVHLGAYICSKGIWPWINEVKKRDLSLVVITNGSLYSRFCQNCPASKAIHELINDGKNINHVPMGWPYNKAIPISWKESIVF